MEKYRTWRRYPRNTKVGRTTPLWLRSRSKRYGRANEAQIIYMKKFFRGYAMRGYVVFGLVAILLAGAAKHNSANDNSPDNTQE